MDRQRIAYLYQKHKSRRFSGDEEREWDSVLANPDLETMLKEVAGADWDALERSALHQVPPSRSKRMLGEILTFPQAKRPRRLWPLAAAAAAVAILVMTALLLYQPQESGIAPGSNRATLTLADGRTIDLSEAQSGIIVDDGISYLDGSAVIGEQAHNFPTSQVHKLITPKGGTYQVTLPDGTNVWLNAASTLKYPSRFTGDERVVELEGEAYFDVSEQAHKFTRSQKIPFKVISKGQTVEVLGTQFNISAYPDEPLIKTTLAEGAVKVSTDHASVTLAPNQQALLEGRALSRKNVLAEEELAWVHGEFQFNEESLESIMRKLARWYQVDVVFADESLKSEAFFGVVSRFDDMSKVLKKLEKTGSARFHIDGQTVVVNKNKDLPMKK